MYLSKIRFDTEAWRVQLRKEGRQQWIKKIEDVGQDAYLAHQLLWTLFANQRQRSFLFRQQTVSKGVPCCLLLSAQRPRATDAVIDSKIFMPILKKDQYLAFDLRLNPTICCTDQQGRKHRHDVMMHCKKNLQQQQQQVTHSAMRAVAIEWLVNAHRSRQWGVSFDSPPQIAGYQRHSSVKTQGGKKPVQLQFSSVDYQGILRVVDPALFLSQYQQGFGRAKAFGCGLMLIRPAEKYC